MTETLEEELVINPSEGIPSRINGNNSPRVSKICLNIFTGFNQLSEEGIFNLVGPDNFERYRKCSGCQRDWWNQYCPEYNPYLIIEGVHS